MSEENNLDDLEKLVGSLLNSLSAGARRTMLRKAARVLQDRQRRRILGNLDPDGKSYAARREKREPKPGKHALRFLYPKGAANPRVVFMRSWVRQGPLVTGFDTEAGGLRSFFWDKIEKSLPVPAADENKGAGRLRGRKGAIRRKKMFRRLANGRFMKAGATAEEAWVGFTGRAAEIASVHQHGELDRPALKAPPVKYAQRILLGLNRDDRAAIIDIVLENMSGAVR